MGREGFRAIVTGGLVAGIVDIGVASLINWLSPVTIMQAIASGWLGRASFQGGARSAAIGFVLQCFMSILIATPFVIAGSRLPVLRRNWAAAGCVYGVVVFFVMEYVVVPLSAVGHQPHFTVVSFFENLAAMLLFGGIIAWFARDTRA